VQGPTYILLGSTAMSVTCEQEDKENNRMTIKGTRMNKGTHGHCER
jgi:hypothetical protein